MLREVRSNDSRGASFCIRMFGDFMLGKHLCITFECEEMNLRQVIKKFGKDVGINISAVQRYSKQLFSALHLLYVNMGTWCLS